MHASSAVSLRSGVVEKILVEVMFLLFSEYEKSEWVSPGWFSAGLAPYQIKKPFPFQGSKAKIRFQLQWRQNLQSRVEGYGSMSLQVSLPHQ